MNSPALSSNSRSQASPIHWEAGCNFSGRFSANKLQSCWLFLAPAVLCGQLQMLIHEMKWWGHKYLTEECFKCLRPLTVSKLLRIPVEKKWHEIWNLNESTAKESKQALLDLGRSYKGKSTAKQMVTVECTDQRGLEKGSTLITQTTKFHPAGNSVFVCVVDSF